MQLLGMSVELGSAAELAQSAPAKAPHTAESIANWLGMPVGYFWEMSIAIALSLIAAFVLYLIHRRSGSILVQHPYQPVPWNGLHLSLLFLIYLLVSVGIGFLLAPDELSQMQAEVERENESISAAPNGANSTGAPAGTPTDGATGNAATQSAGSDPALVHQSPDALHEPAIVRFLREDETSGVRWLWVTLLVLFCAPLGEELLFRILILGWLERLFRTTPVAAGEKAPLQPVFISGLLFGLAHWPSDEAPSLNLLRADAVSKVVFAAICIAWIGLAFPEGWRHAGCKGDRSLRTLMTALAVVLFAFGPIYAFNLLGLITVPESASHLIVPFAMTLVGMVLGLTYQRTRSLWVVVGMHSVWNAFALALMVYAFRSN